MPQSIARYGVLLLVLLLAQILICNHIILFGVAMPVIFIYFILCLPMGLNAKWVLLLAFLTGLIIDIFSDTPGVNALSCTIMAVLRKPVFKLYTGGDEVFSHVVPGISSLGGAMYAKYVVSLVFIYCMLSFSLDYFTFAYFSRMLVKILSSTVLSAALIIGIDSIAGGKRT